MPSYAMLCAMPRALPGAFLGESILCTTSWPILSKLHRTCVGWEASVPPPTACLGAASPADRLWKAQTGTTQTMSYSLYDDKSHYNKNYVENENFI